MINHCGADHKHALMVQTGGCKQTNGQMEGSLLPRGIWVVSPDKSHVTLSLIWLETLSLGIGIHLIFRPQNRNQLKKLESESIYLFNWNLIMAWNRNLFHCFALESESISFYASESESNYLLGESVFGPWCMVREMYSELTGKHGKTSLNDFLSFVQWVAWVSQEP